MDGLPAASSTSGSRFVLVLVVELVVLGKSVLTGEPPRSSPSSTTRTTMSTDRIENRLSIARVRR